MEVIQWNAVISLAVKQRGKPAVWVNNGLTYESTTDAHIWKFVMDRIKKLYGHETEEFYRVTTILINCGLFFFDTVEEQQQFYSIFADPIVDSSSVYACTYSADGVCLTENT